MSRDLELARAARAIFDRADDENREPTAEEQWAAKAMLDEAEALRTKSGRRFAPPGGMSPEQAALFGMASATAYHGPRPGDLFVKSDGWRKVSDPATRGQQWSTGAVDVGDLLGKAGTVLESAQGAGLIPAPQVVPGVVSTLFEPLSVAQLFSQQQATTSQVRYVVEGTAVSGAAGVAEGGEKPESDLAFSTVDEPVKKVATFLTVSDELFEDAPAVQQYLNGRLALFVRAEEERQVLRGAGTNELVGLMDVSRGINHYTRQAADDYAVCLARVIANTAGSSFLQPDAIVLHPSDWLTTRLIRDGAGGTTGAYLGGGPIVGSYGIGGAASAGLFGQRLWDTQVVLSTQVGVGTALVGAFRQGGAVYRRGGVTVEASNSHESYFKYDLVALRAESREALCVYRPSAFTEVIF